MSNTIFHDKSMLFLVLIAAFFVGASATNALMDDSFADKDDNNGSNGCERSGQDKACEKNPNTDPECLPPCPDCPPPGCGLP